LSPDLSVLIEAKAHTSEMSSSCAAASPASVSKIRAAFAETKTGLGVADPQDWCEGYYQYANRLAHAYLLNELNGVPAQLVFLYFVGDADMGGPTSQQEWEAAIKPVHAHLGLHGRLPAYVRNAFVDVRAIS
jgi:hypothetical protein